MDGAPREFCATPQARGSLAEGTQVARTAIISDIPYRDEDVLTKRFNMV
jgi:hypothetical protein